MRKAVWVKERQVWHHLVEDNGKCYQDGIEVKPFNIEARRNTAEAADSYEVWEN